MASLLLLRCKAKKGFALRVPLSWVRWHLMIHHATILQWNHVGCVSLCFLSLQSSLPRPSVLFFHILLLHLQGKSRGQVKINSHSWIFSLCGWCFHGVSMPYIQLRAFCFPGTHWVVPRNWFWLAAWQITRRWPSKEEMKERPGLKK